MFGQPGIDGHQNRRLLEGKSGSRLLIHLLSRHDVQSIVFSSSESDSCGEIFICQNQDELQVGTVHPSQKGNREA